MPNFDSRFQFFFMGIRIICEMARKTSPRSYGFSQRILKCGSDYFKTSSLHGFRNIALEENNYFERTFWALLCLSCTIMTVVMITMMWQRFNESPTSTTIESTNYPISKVEFPAITVCNLNKIREESAKEVIKIFARQGIEESVMRTFLKRLPQTYVGRSLDLNDDKDVEAEIIKNVSIAMDELGYDLESLLFDLSQSCQDLLVRCVWFNRDFDCLELFEDIKTPEGFCCVFNWQGPEFEGYSTLHIRKEYLNYEKKYSAPRFRDKKFVNGSSIPTNGLTVVVDAQEWDHFASVDSFFGCVVILHEPTQYPDISAIKTFVQPKFEVMIRLRPTVIESAPSVRRLCYHQRQCLFQDEWPLAIQNFYSYEACTLEYKIRAYSRACNCVPFYYPNITQMRACGLEDLDCLRDNQALGNQESQDADENWRVGDSNFCSPSCNSIKYDWIVQGNKIYYKEYASPIFRDDFNNKSVFNMFFEDSVCIKYRTESLMTWESLIASFGGIFGLCLGGSIVSLIEILYYFTYNLFWKNTIEIKGRNIIFVQDQKYGMSEEAKKKLSEIRKIDPVSFQIGRPFYSNSSLPWVE